MKTTKKMLSVLLAVVMIALTPLCVPGCLIASAADTIAFGSYRRQEWPIPQQLSR